MKKHLIICLLALVLAPAGNISCQEKPTKLYWFIPDGVRAEPDLMKIYEWAEKGYLPNIKYMMDHGAYGYSKPLFPTHTPVNFAALLSGTTPKINGVADGPMHTEGFSLDKVSVGGFRSSARRVPAIWSIMEKAGKKTAILSVPGSTPPEVNKGIVVRGRWGGWGADVHAINFEMKLKGEQRYNQGRGAKLFFFGPQLTQYLDAVTPTGWTIVKKSFSPPMEISLTSWGATVFGYIYDSSDDKKTNYDRVLFSADKTTELADIKQGEWSDWKETELSWQERKYKSNYMFHVIKLDDDGFFRLRIFYNNVNEFLTQPPEVAEELTSNVGPMVDFVDNFPPQLIYYPEDKNTFLQEMNKSFDWHTKAIPYMLKTYSPDVVIHDVYDPNQMLTSRWWLGYIDKESKRYNDVKEPEREKLLDEVLGMYKRLDAMLGEIIKNTDENMLVVFSSDHGACVLNKWVRLNNLLAKNGYLKFTIDKETGEPVIDWRQTKAVYLKMDGIYIRPDGLAGEWHRGSGPEYEKLRNDIIKLLQDLTDEDGTNPVTSITKWEDAENFLDLPKDRVGDLIISNKAGYGWNEEMSTDLKLFDVPLQTGYKQAILVDETKAMWTPFIIMGKGVKPGTVLNQPITHIDQLPTILKLMGMEIPSYVEGKPIEQVFK